MKITFDSEGDCMPDFVVPEFARDAVARNQDVHISNELALLWLRATLVRIPKDKRPETTWILCGVEVNATDDMRLDYWPPEASLSEKALEILLWPENPEHEKLQLTSN
jgi:hypothetical protein